MKKFAQWHVDIRIRILLLERAPDLRQNAVGRPERNRLVELEFSLFDEVQGCHGQRGFEDGLHRRMSVRIEIAVEACAGKRARDRYFPVGLGRDGGDFLL